MIFQSDRNLGSQIFSWFYGASQCGKKHLWSLLSVFFCHHQRCCSSECSQILGQVLMKMWKWDYVRRKNDSPASKDSLKSLFFHCTAKSFCFAVVVTASLKVIKKILAFLTTSGRLQLLTMRRDKKGTLFFLLNHLMEFCWLISFDLPKAILPQSFFII